MQVLEVQLRNGIASVDEEGEGDSLAGDIVAANGNADAGGIVRPLGMEAGNLAWRKFTAERREVCRAVRKRGSGSERTLRCKLHANSRVDRGEARDPSIHELLHRVCTHHSD